ncbi:hypothetical protein [Paraburkholderia sp. C35]|uniref:terminase small subunit-like protein n=1 Tax=Paraburkholderia sp. C35 TaxID=2126993 RepID=UPI000D69C935|nr:hypothetical protein [Paraburkholderia sp. C35]
MAVNFTNKPQQKAVAVTTGKAKASPRGKRITNKAYPQETYDKLFAWVASGEDLTTACKHQGMPTPWTVRRRLAVDDALNDQYLKANRIRLHGLADSLVRLPDEALEGYTKVSPADRLNAAKQKGDSIKFLITKGLAEFAGDGEDNQQNITINLINSPDAPAALPGVALPFVPAGQPVLKIVGGANHSDVQDVEPNEGQS